MLESLWNIGERKLVGFSTIDDSVLGSKGGSGACSTVVYKHGFFSRHHCDSETRAHYQDRNRGSSAAIFLVESRHLSD